LRGNRLEGYPNHLDRTRTRRSGRRAMIGMTVRRNPQTNKSGTIWRLSSQARSATIRRVCSRLEREYGCPRFGNPEDPLDDLVYIVLSNRTSPGPAARTYETLRRVYPRWEDVLSQPITKLRSILRPIGLSNIRAKYLRATLRRIRFDFGVCDLNALRGRPESEIEAYLSNLPGVSKKVAKCVIMYTLGGTGLPVDAHVHRVASRLGWVRRHRADQCHQELESLVPAARRHAFHVDCIAHGRRICRASQPLCPECVVRRDCEYFKTRTHDE
jgi:endonuclease III